MTFKKSNGSEKYNFLKCKNVLIFVFIVFIGNVIELGTKSDYTTIAILLLVGLITSFFSKNMIVIMILAMSVANVLKYGTKITNPWKGNEGFIHSGKEEEKKKDESKEGFKSPDEEEEVLSEEDETEEVVTVEKEPKKEKKEKEEMTTKNTTKHNLIESDALDDLRAEMKIGFKRLNQNIDSISSMGLFN